MTWINVAEQMPENGKDVLVFCGRILTAAYFGRFELEAYDDSFGDELDYNEETDEYFAPQGWYENSEHNPDYMYVYKNEITHWMENPEPPAT